MKEFSFKINGAEYKCAVEELEAGKTKVTVNGKVYTVETEAAAPAPKPAAKPAPAAPKPAAAPASGIQVKSPLPGSVIKVLVAEGQAVKKGDTLGAIANRYGTSVKSIQKAPKVFVERLVVAGYAATDARGVSGEDGCYLGDILSNVKRTETGHPLVSLIDDLFRLVEEMIVGEAP